MLDLEVIKRIINIRQRVSPVSHPGEWHDIISPEIEKIQIDAHISHGMFPVLYRVCANDNYSGEAITWGPKLTEFCPETFLDNKGEGDPLAREQVEEKDRAFDNADKNHIVRVHFAHELDQLLFFEEIALGKDRLKYILHEEILLNLLEWKLIGLICFDSNDCNRYKHLLHELKLLDINDKTTVYFKNCITWLRFAFIRNENNDIASEYMTHWSSERHKNIYNLLQNNNEIELNHFIDNLIEDLKQKIIPCVNKGNNKDVVRNYESFYSRSILEGFYFFIKNIDNDCNINRDNFILQTVDVPFETFRENREYIGAFVGTRVTELKEVACGPGNYFEIFRGNNINDDFKDIITLGNLLGRDLATWQIATRNVEAKRNYQITHTLSNFISNINGTILDIKNGLSRSNDVNFLKNLCLSHLKFFQLQNNLLYQSTQVTHGASITIKKLISGFKSDGVRIFIDEEVDTSDRDILNIYYSKSIEDICIDSVIKYVICELAFNATKYGLREKEINIIIKINYSDKLLMFDVENHVRRAHEFERKGGLVACERLLKDIYREKAMFNLCIDIKRNLIIQKLRIPFNYE